MPVAKDRSRSDNVNCVSYVYSDWMMKNLIKSAKNTWFPALVTHTLLEHSGMHLHSNPESFCTGKPTVPFGGRRLDIILRILRMHWKSRIEHWRYLENVEESTWKIGNGQIFNLPNRI